MSQHFTPVSSGARLSDQVAEQLSAEIKLGRLAPGDKLPTEARLVEQFAVSRTVVREAVSRLKSLGLVDSRQGSGVFVSAQQPFAPLNFEARHAASQEAVVQMVEVRRALEAEVAALAAERRNASDLQAIEQAVQALDQAVQSGGDGVAEDVNFHRAIAEATNNSRFSMFIDDMGERLIPRRMLNPSFVDEQARMQFLDMIEIEHQQIFEAISDRKPDEARVAMRRHLEDGRRRYREWSLMHPL